MTKEEFLKELPDNLANEDFYELCKVLMDLALDSEKIRFEDGKVGARFSPEGMANASKVAKVYMESHNMDEETLIKAIRVHAYKAVDDNDNRQKAYFDQSQSDSRVSGVLYIFTDIPDGILRKIIQDASKN